MHSLGFKDKTFVIVIPIHDNAVYYGMCTVIASNGRHRLSSCARIFYHNQKL